MDLRPALRTIVDIGERTQRPVPAFIVHRLRDLCPPVIDERILVKQRDSYPPQNLRAYGKLFPESAIERVSGIKLDEIFACCSQQVGVLKRQVDVAPFDDTEVVRVQVPRATQGNEVFKGDSVIRLVEFVNDVVSIHSDGKAIDAVTGSRCVANRHRDGVGVQDTWDDRIVSNRLVTIENPAHRDAEISFTRESKVPHRYLETE